MLSLSAEVAVWANRILFKVEYVKETGEYKLSPHTAKSLFNNPELVYIDDLNSSQVDSLDHGMSIPSASANSVTIEHLIADQSSPLGNDLTPPPSLPPPLDFKQTISCGDDLGPVDLVMPTPIGEDDQEVELLITDQASG